MSHNMLWCTPVASIWRCCISTCWPTGGAHTALKSLLIKNLKYNENKFAGSTVLHTHTFSMQHNIWTVKYCFVACSRRLFFINASFQIPVRICKQTRAKLSLLDVMLMVFQRCRLTKYQSMHCWTTCLQHVPLFERVHPHLAWNKAFLFTDIDDLATGYSEITIFHMKMSHLRNVLCCFCLLVCTLSRETWKIGVKEDYQEWNSPQYKYLISLLHGASWYFTAIINPHWPSNSLSADHFLQKIYAQGHESVFCLLDNRFKRDWLSWATELIIPRFYSQWSHDLCTVLPVPVRYHQLYP